MTGLRTAGCGREVPVGREPEIEPRSGGVRIVMLLNETANRALQDPGIRKIMLEQGNEIAGGSPDQFAALIKSELVRWAKVVKDAKMEPE